MDNNNNKWSYVRLNGNNFITDIHKKEVILSNATDRFYYWRQGSDFVEFALATMDTNDRVKGEFYVAVIYKYGMNKFNCKYMVSLCEKM